MELRTLFAVCIPAFVIGLSGARASAIDLPFRASRLRNGLTLIVAEDHDVPLAAVNVVYKVGAKDEVPGRTGFAHLFEHLMFMGTTRAPTGTFDALIESGGGSNNAWTSSDLTDYHEMGPNTLLPTLLWLEADRLSALGREIDGPKLDLQRSVVLNERRQSIENRPYGVAELVMPELLFPASHPYHHPVIGSAADIEAAQVPDVKAFFARHYRPDNAAIAVVGDVDPRRTEALVERYFGWISPEGSSPAPAPPAAPPKLGSVVRKTIADRVEMPKILFAYRSPRAFAPGDAELDLLASILASGKSGRLYQSLVYEKGLAQAVEAEQQSSLLSGTFMIEVLVRPGVALDAVEKATDAVLRDAQMHDPSEAELARAKTEFEFRFVDRLQSVAARASLLNTYWAETGDPGFVNRDLARYRAVTAVALRTEAARALDPEDRVILNIVPQTAAPAREPAEEPAR